MSSSADSFVTLNKLRQLSGYQHWDYQDGVYSARQIDRDDTGWAMNLLARISTKPSAIDSGPDGEEAKEWVGLEEEFFSVDKLNRAIAREQSALRVG